MNFVFCTIEALLFPIPPNFVLPYGLSFVSSLLPKPFSYPSPKLCSFPPSKVSYFFLRPKLCSYLMPYVFCYIPHPKLVLLRCLRFVPHHRLRFFSPPPELYSFLIPMLCSSPSPKLSSSSPPKLCSSPPPKLCFSPQSKICFSSTWTLFFYAT